MIWNEATLPPEDDAAGNAPLNTAVAVAVAVDGGKAVVVLAPDSVNVSQYGR